jgi:SAM-dependent methyltransferase
MPSELTNRDLLKFLKNKQIRTGFLDGLKLHYRPLICPYISLINMIKPGSRVGDIGCGSGQFFLLLSEFTKPSFLFGIEINDKLIANAAKLLDGFSREKFKLEVYDGIHFPPEMGEMDIIFLIDVLHHVEQKNQTLFLQRIAELMKPGSTLVIKDIDAANPLVIFNKLHDLVISKEIGHELKCDETIRLLKQNHLEIVDCQKTTTYVYPHYTVVAKKQ